MTAGLRLTPPVQWTMTLMPDGTAEVVPSQGRTRAIKPIAAQKVN